jgi:methionyl-tRNA formyltransferase
MMRIVFIGTVDFSQHCLQEVLRCGGKAVAVLTLSPERSRFNTDYADLRPVADKHGVPVHHIQKINEPTTVGLIRSLQPDVIFVFGFSQLITSEILRLPPLGCIGVHPTLLPKNRGRHPLIWALVEGLEESGLSFFYIDEGADSGDLLWQKAFPITLGDDAASLYVKIKALAAEAIAEFLPQLEQGVAPRKPQNHALASYWRKRGEKDGEIHWDLPSLKTYNLIRALTRPYVGAHTFANGQKVIIWRAELPVSALPHEAANLAPGTVFSQNEGSLAVRTGDAFLNLCEWEAPGDIDLISGTRLEGDK